MTINIPAGAVHYQSKKKAISVSEHTASSKLLQWEKNLVKAHCMHLSVKRAWHAKGMNGACLLSSTHCSSFQCSDLDVIQSMLFTIVSHDSACIWTCTIKNKFRGCFKKSMLSKNQFQPTPSSRLECRILGSSLSSYKISPSCGFVNTVDKFFCYKRIFHSIQH